MNYNVHPPTSSASQQKAAIPSRPSTGTVVNTTLTLKLPPARDNSSLEVGAINRIEATAKKRERPIDGLEYTTLSSPPPHPIHEHKSQKRFCRRETNGADTLISSSSITASADDVKPSSVGLKTYERNDVLSGRGGGTNQHEGNCYFRSLITKYREKYLRAKKKDKPRITLSIVKAIRARNGRFLKRDEDSLLWFEIGDEEAREKTGQALRQRAPMYRKLLFEDQQEVRVRNDVLNMSSSITSSTAEGPNASIAAGITSEVPNASIAAHATRTLRPSIQQHRLQEGVQLMNQRQPTAIACPPQNRPYNFYINPRQHHNMLVDGGLLGGTYSWGSSTSNPAQSLIALQAAYSGAQVGPRRTYDHFLLLQQKQALINTYNYICQMQTQEQALQNVQLQLHQSSSPAQQQRSHDSSRPPAWFHPPPEQQEMSNNNAGHQSAGQNYN